MSRKSRRSRPAKRGAPGTASKVPIDHSAIIDGHAMLADRTHYEDRMVPCGDCGEPTLFTAAAQKLVYERHRVPVKMTGAACVTCRKKRATRREKREASAEAHDALEAAVRRVAEAPDDPAALLAVVEARLASSNAGGRVSRQKTVEWLARARRAGASQRSLDALAAAIEDAFGTEASSEC